ncbi:feruloyl esterase C [Fusarium agapanthi]|uniref:Feruloyl esterase C n=1 Tax=Fusarium agapanthi TaxID=1803897 RepID=A0A9P5B4D6_9HYPO|nr:feruloyl esterase C [Fusarium agapanthi]
MKSLLTLTLALFASAGCGKQTPSSGVKTMQVNDKNREYTLQLPNNYQNNKPHRRLVRSSQLGLAGDSTIFIAPNGLNAGWANQGGEDITFTDQMLAFAKQNLCIDEKQVFATGFSYGGAMSHSVACSRPNDFAAVAVISGALLSGCNGGNTPVSYLHIHGSADNVLSIQQGRQQKQVNDPAPGAQNYVKTSYTCGRKPVTWIGHGGGHIGDPTANGQKFAPGETWSFFNAAAGTSAKLRC